MAAVVEKKGKIPTRTPNDVLNDLRHAVRQALIILGPSFEAAEIELEAMNTGKCLHKNVEPIRTPGVRKGICQDCGETVPLPNRR